LDGDNKIINNMPPKNNGDKHYYGFDPSGLEKAAAVSLISDEI
jgi:hypothetical protein